MGFLMFLLACASFARLCRMAWDGQLGLVALGFLLIAVVSFMLGRRRLDGENRAFVTMVGKLGFTFAGCMALLRHPIPCPPDGGADCVPLPVYATITEYIDKVEVTPETFLMYAGLAMAIKFVGVLSSAFAWHLLLIGQGIRFPYWQKIVTSFLIGRFIGTF